MFCYQSGDVHLLVSHDFALLTTRLGILPLVRGIRLRASHRGVGEAINVSCSFWISTFPHSSPEAPSCAHACMRPHNSRLMHAFRVCACVQPRAPLIPSSHQRSPDHLIDHPNITHHRVLEGVGPSFSWQCPKSLGAVPPFSVGQVMRLVHPGLREEQLVQLPLRHQHTSGDRDHGSQEPDTASPSNLSDRLTPPR